MLDDLFELIVFIFDDIIDFFRIGWKEKRKRRKEADEKQRKADRERPL
ncbi:MAG: hypothetical protein IJN89_08865 [Anaerotignum sp.]|nr:hypothetical protein [Anaerotignum sp.]